MFNLNKVNVEAWKLVKANAGSAWVDEESIQDFEADLKGNLLKHGVCILAQILHSLSSCFCRDRKTSGNS